MTNNTLPEIESLMEQVKTGNHPQVNGFTLDSYLGHGAFAHVVKAFGDRFGRIPLVLKFPINQEAIADIKSRRNVLSALGRSPYSVNMHSTGEINYQGYPVVAEEYHEESLADKIASNVATGKKLSLEEVVEVGRQLLTGIDYFHRLGETDPGAAKDLGVQSLTHNDIKPSNIMIEQGKLKYNDFGLRFEDMPGGQVSLVNSISAISIHSRDKAGKVNRNVYAAPEVREALLRQQASRENIEIPAGIPTDLWSVGAIIFAYAAGNAPQWGQRDLREERADLPEELNDFFGKILQGTPERRFQSARDALSALENAAIAEDAYVYGIARGQDESHFVFKQPIKNGKAVQKPTAFNFKEGGGSPPSLTYLPEVDRLALVNAKNERDDSEKYSKAFILLEENLNRCELRAYNSEAIPQIVRNKRDGRIVVNMIWVDKSVLNENLNSFIFPSMSRLTEKTSCFSPKIFGGEWREYKPSVNSSKYRVSVSNGEVKVYSGVDYQKIPIPGRILSAFIVDKKEKK